MVLPLYPTREFLYIRNIELQERQVLEGAILALSPDGQDIDVLIFDIGIEYEEIVLTVPFRDQYRVQAGIDLAGTPEVTHRAQFQATPYLGYGVVVILSEDGQRVEGWCELREYRDALRKRSNDSA